MRARWWMVVGCVAVGLAGCTVPANVRLASDGGPESAADGARDAGPETADAPGGDGNDAPADAREDAIGLDVPTPDVVVPDAVVTPDTATPDAVVMADVPAPDAVVPMDTPMPDAVVPMDTPMPDAVVPMDVPAPDVVVPTDVAPDVTVMPDVPRDVAADADLCRSALECADGVYCNGDERCMPGAPGASVRGCLPAAAPRCNPATQYCTEATRRCDLTACMTPDRDGDGHLAVACGGDDCADDDPQRFPGNFEVCDRTGHDEDCNPATLGMTDYDGDGAVYRGCCMALATGGVTCGTDCDDGRAFINPAGTETCNGFDDNCNGDIDEGFPRMTYYYDADGDLYGNPSTGVLACAAPLSYYLQGGDCNDAEETIYPGHGCP